MSLSSATLAVPEPPGRGSGRPPRGTPDAKLPRLRFPLLLLGLVLAVLLPALGLGGVAVWQAIRQAEAAATERLLDTARALALAVDREIGSYRSAMLTLAGSRTLDGPVPDLAGFEIEARRAAEALGTSVTLLHAETLRQLVNTALPPGAPAGGVSAADFRAVAEAGQPLVTDLVTGTVARRPVVGVAVPVRRDGAIPFALSARLEPERLRSLLAAQGLQEGSFAAVADARQVLVARSDALHAQLLGRAIPPENAQRFAGRVSGTYRAVALDGVERVLGFHRSAAAPGWMVFVAQPVAAFGAGWQASLRALALGGALALALGGAVALLAARGVLVPVDRLSRHARALATEGAGDATAAAIPPARVAELEALRRGFAEAEAAAQRREAALRESEARLRLTGEAAGLGVFECDLTTGATHWSAPMYRLYGIDPATPPPGMGLDGAHLDLVHPEDRDGLRAARAALAADPATSTFALEFRIRRADTGETRWIASRGEFLRAGAGRPVLVRGAQHDVTERRGTEERLRLMVDELNHRVKNTLATVQSIAAQTLRGADPALRRVLDGRLMALAAAHDVLTREGWSGASLDEVVAGVLAPHGGREGGRFAVAGPRLRLAPRPAVALSMVLHELATNALKYGALSVPAGRVALRWEVGTGPAPCFRMAWEESGGPPVAAAPRRGFGARLLERGLAQDLGGTASLGFAPGGVVCRIEAPLARVAAPAEPPPLLRVGRLARP